VFPAFEKFAYLRIMRKGLFYLGSINSCVNTKVRPLGKYLIALQ
jgi:hypothetical protein